MTVPEGIDLSWTVIIFLGSIVTAAFLASWKLFSVRNADHVTIAANLSKVKHDLKNIIAENYQANIISIDQKYTILDERITRSREDIIDKIDGKCESIKKEIDRNDRDTEEQYKELHARMNRGTDELGEVKGEMREVRGEQKLVTKIVIDKLGI